MDVFPLSNDQTKGKKTSNLFSVFFFVLICNTFVTRLVFIIDNDYVRNCKIANIKRICRHTSSNSSSYSDVYLVLSTMKIIIMFLKDLTRIFILNFYQKKNLIELNRIHSCDSWVYQSKSFIYVYDFFFPEVSLGKGIKYTEKEETKRGKEII